MAQTPHLPQELRSLQVLIRFGFRIVILLVFASFGGIGFTRSLVALLWMSILLSAVVAMMKRDAPFGAILNHWDETVAYTALFCLVHVFQVYGFDFATPA